MSAIPEKINTLKNLALYSVQKQMQIDTVGRRSKEKLDTQNTKRIRALDRDLKSLLDTLLPRRPGGGITLDLGRPEDRGALPESAWQMLGLEQTEEAHVLVDVYPEKKKRVLQVSVQAKNFYLRYLKLTTESWSNGASLTGEFQSTQLKDLPSITDAQHTLYSLFNSSDTPRQIDLAEGILKFVVDEAIRVYQGQQAADFESVVAQQS